MPLCVDNDVDKSITVSEIALDEVKIFLYSFREMSD